MIFVSSKTVLQTTMDTMLYLITIMSSQFRYICVHNIVLWKKLFPKYEILGNIPKYQPKDRSSSSSVTGNGPGQVPLFKWCLIAWWFMVVKIMDQWEERWRYFKPMKLFASVIRWWEQYSTSNPQSDIWRMIPNEQLIITFVTFYFMIIK